MLKNYAYIVNIVKHLLVKTTMNDANEAFCCIKTVSNSI